MTNGLGMYCPRWAKATWFRQAQPKAQSMDAGDGVNLRVSPASESQTEKSAV